MKTRTDAAGPSSVAEHVQADGRPPDVVSSASGGSSSRVLGAHAMWRVALGLAGVGLGADLAALERRLAAQARGAETPGGLSERADSSPLCDAYAQTRMQ